MLEEDDLLSVIKPLDKRTNGRYQAHVLWNHMAKMKCPDGRQRFGKLSKTAMLVLTIPHSNAAEERVFSMIRKNQTSFRPSLDPKEILSSLITIKMEVENRGEDKYSFPPTVIREAKSATRKYNRAQKTTYS